MSADIRWCFPESLSHARTKPFILYVTKPVKLRDTRPWNPSISWGYWHTHEDRTNRGKQWNQSSPSTRSSTIHSVAICQRISGVTQSVLISCTGSVAARLYRNHCWPRPWLQKEENGAERLLRAMTQIVQRDFVHIDDSTPNLGYFSYLVEKKWQTTKTLTLGQLDLWWW